MEEVSSVSVWLREGHGFGPSCGWAVVGFVAAAFGTAQPS